MIFSSFPVYLDPPNWPQQQQQPNQEPAAGGMLCSSDQITQLPPALPVQPGVGPGSIRPGSMSDRARLAKIPQPEAGLKCPRCESTNTKFCYFNNYSLTQPRHFCKTCRRYWTRGGALRNVPVGGGCRRNKRSKGSNRSKSPSVAAAPVSSSTTSGGGGGGGGACSTSTSTAFSRDVILSGHNLHSPSQVFPLLPPFNSFSDFIASDMGLNFGAMRKIPCTDVEFQVGTNTNSTSILTDQWRLQQFPSFQLSQFGLYPLEGDQGGTDDDHQLFPKPLDSGDQVPDIKMEEINCGLNTSKNFQGMTRISPYWPRSTSSTGNNGWGPDLSNGFSSSTDHLL